MASEFVEFNAAGLTVDADRSLRISLPDGEAVDVVFESVRHGLLGDFWQGRLSGPHRGYVNLSVVQGDVAGQILGSAGRFLIRPLGNGIHAIHRIDQSRFATCGNDPFEINPVHIHLRTDSSNANPGADDDGSVVDVLVAYTATAAGQSGNILAEIQAAIDDANRAYELSSIDLRLNLVQTTQVDYAGGDLCDDRDAFARGR
ncbi:MAG: hypothetical protein H6684_09250 [Deltaproteobacteria bacterium]|nr:hypothetical protein [Deltaproteobacteria bacterium]